MELDPPVSSYFILQVSTNIFFSICHSLCFFVAIHIKCFLSGSVFKSKWTHPIIIALHADLGKFVFFNTSSLVTILPLLSFCLFLINSFMTLWTNKFIMTLPVSHEKFSQVCFKNLSLNVGLRSNKGGALSSILEWSGKLTKDSLLRQNCLNHLMIVFPLIHVLTGKSDSGKLSLSSWFLNIFCSFIA